MCDRTINVGGERGQGFEGSLPTPRRNIGKNRSYNKLLGALE